MVFNNYEEYKKLSGVYLIINLKNNFVYVGATSSEFRLRYQTHKSYLRNNKHYNKELQSDYNKYGEDYFVFEVAEIEEDIEKIKNAETRLIHRYIDEESCYNIMSGGQNVGNVASEETKHKMSVAHKGNRLSEYQKKRLMEYNRNKTLSDDTKQKLSKIFQGENSNFSILKECQVAEIKTKIIQGEKDSDIAKKFGVSEGCISNIRYGYRWEYLIVDGWEEYQNNRKRRKTYTEEEIFNIKKDILDGKNNSYINKKYRISYDKINSIRKDM